MRANWSNGCKLYVFSKAQHHMPRKGDTYELWRVCKVAARLTAMMMPRPLSLPARGSSFCALRLHRHRLLDPPSPCRRRCLSALRCLRPSEASADRCLLLLHSLRLVHLRDRGIQKCSVVSERCRYCPDDDDDFEKIASAMMETCGRLEVVCLGE